MIELGEESKANKAASEGKKYNRSPSHDVIGKSKKAEFDDIIAERRRQIRSE
jgi:hypothetical protein